MKRTDPLQDVICLELPLNVKNIDKAIEAVGGSKEIERVTSEAAFAKEPEGLQLKLRKDRFHHPINSAPIETNNIVVEVTLPSKCFTDGGDLRSALKNAAAANSAANSAAAELISVEPKFTIRHVHRFREIADFQYYTANSPFAQQLERSIFPGDIAEIQKLSLRKPPAQDDILPPPRFTVSTQPFYYGYKQSPYVKVIDDDSGQRRIVQTSSTAKVISNVLNWGDPVPTEPPAELETNPKANVKQCLDELRTMFSKRPSYTRRSLQHKLGGYMSRYLKYALPYLCYYYRSGPWRGAYILYGRDPSKEPELAKYQVEHFRIASDDNKLGKEENGNNEDRKSPAASEDYSFDGTVFPDVPMLQLSDIADGFLEPYIETQDLRTEVDVNDGWYKDKTITCIRKVLRAELVELKDNAKVLSPETKKGIIECLDKN